MNKFNVNLFLFIFISLVLSLVLAKSFSVKAAAATHVVISEVQVAGAMSGDDFIELYNPTASEVSLADLRLVKRTSTGVTNDSIVAFAADDSIAAHGYFLWCNTSLGVSLVCDSTTSATVSNDNSVALSTDPLDGGTLIDAVTFGAPANPLGEGTFLTAPAASMSVERKANSTSDATSMGSGGVDELMGNGEDTDNNSADFVLRTASQPQNSLSAVEPTLASPEPSPSESPSPAPSASPSTEPSASPIPSVAPSPSVEPSPSPSVAPSPNPSVVASPSTSPSVAPSVAPSPSPTPKVIGVFHFPNKTLTCKINYSLKQFGTFMLRIPKISCTSS